MTTLFLTNSLFQDDQGFYRLERIRKSNFQSRNPEILTRPQPPVFPHSIEEQITVLKAVCPTISDQMSRAMCRTILRSFQQEVI